MLRKPVRYTEAVLGRLRHGEEDAMSGGLKTGCIFGPIQVILIIGLTLIGMAFGTLNPLLGAAGLFCCGPLGSLLSGGLAGYIGVRWNKQPAGVGQGVLASGIAGIGALLGSVLLWGGLYAFIAMAAQSDPAIMQDALDQALSQQPGLEMTPDELQSLFGPILIGVGLCTGLISLLFTMGGGALGGWLQVRQRAQEAPPAPPTPPAEPTVV